MLTDAPPAIHNRLAVTVGKDRWVFLCRDLTAVEEDRNHDARLTMATVSKNGRYVHGLWQEPRWFPDMGFYKFRLLKIPSPHPVVAVWGHPGMSNTWFTRYFRIEHGQFRPMGQVKCDVKGPRLWHGRRDHWLIDHADSFPHLDRRYRTLYRIDHHGRLHRLRTWRTRAT